MSVRDWAILRHLDVDLLESIRSVFVFGNAGDEAFIITHEDEVYVVGKNRNGCLGFENAGVRINEEWSPSLSEINIKDFAVGYKEQQTSSLNQECMNVVAVTKDGKVYEWGSHSYDSNRRLYSLPHAVIISNKVKEVACGSSHFLALSENGMVYSWGFNCRGQLGIGRNYDTDDNQYFKTSAKITGEILGKTVIEIACGSYFSLALVDDGNLFGWGCCNHGQLGFKNGTSYGSEKKYDPVRVPLPSAIKIRRIACGPAHVLALNRDGELYVWGKANLKQLGREVTSYLDHIGYNNTSYSLPHKLEINHRFIDISASNLRELSVATTENNDIIFWGQSTTGHVFLPTLSNCKSVYEVFAHHARVMHKSLIIPENKRMTLAESLEKELGNKETSDMIIQLGTNEEIHVHKAILMMRSKYFKNNLPPQLRVDKRIVRMKTVSDSAMKAYLKYIYTDDFQVNLDLAVELFKLAEKFDDNDFKVICEQNIKRQMTPEKAAELYAATRKLSGAEDLSKFCLEFAVKHAREVMNSPSFAEWDLETLKSFLPEYVKMKDY